MTANKTPAMADLDDTVIARLPDIHRNLVAAYTAGALKPEGGSGIDACAFAEAQKIMTAWDLPDAPAVEPSAEKVSTWDERQRAVLAEPAVQVAAHMEPVGRVKDHFAGTDKAYRTVIWADRTFAMDVPDGAYLYAAPIAAPVSPPDGAMPKTTEEARAYLMKWHRTAFKDAPHFNSYIENTLAGDFAYHLARYLAAQPAEGSAPVARTEQQTTIIEILRAQVKRLEEQQNTRRPDFLLNGTRFKLNFSSRGNVDVFHNYAAELQGRWVALVPAEDDMHLSSMVLPERSDTPAPDDASEGVEILDSLIANIEEGGNYSKEATLTFLGQIRQCFARIDGDTQGAQGDANA